MKEIRDVKGTWKNVLSLANFKIPNPIVRNKNASRIGSPQTKVIIPVLKTNTSFNAISKISKLESVDNHSNTSFFTETSTIALKKVRIGGATLGTSIPPIISRKMPPAKYQEADDNFVSPGFGGNEASFDLTLGNPTKHISSLR